ncbi:MAG: glycosyltransferase family 39 protein [Patescibacteria group bacterium]
MRNILESKFLIVLVALGISVSLFLGVLSEKIFKTSIDDWGNDAYSYNATALSLVRHQTIHDSSTFFYGPFQRPPGYAIFLAVVYGIFGEYPVAVFVSQILIWILTLILIFEIAKRFFDFPFSTIPPLMTAVYWGVATYVIDINSDVFALFLNTALIWSFFKWRDKSNSYFAVLQGILFAFLVLTKPIVLYAIPFYIVAMFIIKKRINKKLIIDILVVLIIALLPIGAWAQYNHKIVGNYGLASGALTLMRRADDVNFSKGRINSFVIASFFGDYVADYFYPGYANDPEPYTKESIEREKRYYQNQKQDKSNEGQLQAQYYAEAKNLIMSHPVKFVMLGSIYLQRLNSPVNLEGVELIHTFVVKDGSFSIIKFLILIGIHLVWLIFIFVVVFGVILAIRMDWKKWFLILFFILYFNGTYALLTHAEARYIIPVIPFYFFLVVVCWQRFRAYLSK